jgi:steroid delta-isomerase-like uncharacterized protein
MKCFGALALATCLALASCSSISPSNRDNIAQNVALGRRVFTEIYGAGKVSLVDELYSDDFVDDSPGGGKGRDLIKAAVADFHKAFPDLHIDIEDAFAIGDKVVLRYSAHGTQTGPYGSIPPTGKVVTGRGITVFQIVNGKIKTEWTEYDRLGILRQLGIIPS